MSDGGPSLALMARLHEAVTWGDAERRHEADPWSYMRRKLRDCEAPLRAYKAEVFAAAKKSLLDDLALPLVPPGALAAHKEAFEGLIPIGDFADLSYHLEPGADRKTRLEGARAVLESAKAPTLFDHEALPPEKRSRAWEKRVDDMRRRLGLESAALIVARGEMTPAKRAYVTRRLRRRLAEYLAVTRGEGALRDEITPFMLARIEAAAAAVLRILDRWR